MPNGVGSASECQEFLRGFREAFESGLTGLRPGELAPPVRVAAHLFTCLWRESLARDGAVDGWCVWQNLGSEIALHIAESRVALREGIVLAGLRLRCEEVGESELVVPLATGTMGGSRDDPAGLLVAGEVMARGLPLLVDVWGETAVIACYAAVVDVAAMAATAAGDDRAGYPLLPGAIYALPDEFVVVPQARHAVGRPLVRR